MGPMILSSGNRLYGSHLCKRCSLGKGSDIGDEYAPGKGLWATVVECKPQVSRGIESVVAYRGLCRNWQALAYVHMPSQPDMKVKEKAKICAKLKSLYGPISYLFNERALRVQTLVLV